MRITHKNTAACFKCFVQPVLDFVVVLLLTHTHSTRTTLSAYSLVNRQSHPKVVKWRCVSLQVCVCIMCSACFSIYILWHPHTWSTQQMQRHRHKAVVLSPYPDSKQHMLEGCIRAERERESSFLLSSCLRVFAGGVLALCVLLRSLQEKWKKMGHHSEGNSHALRLTTGSMCVYSWLGSWCVCCVAPGCLGSIPFLCMPEPSFQDEFSERLRPTLHFGSPCDCLIHTVSFQGSNEKANIWLMPVLRFR